MEYNFREIEKKWQQHWEETGAYKVSNESDKPKYYVLDMFPYPSGAGLHVGHPLGYIASDIFARFKRLKGYNVLHPMGYDAFGLPAEQYAIEHGVHPAVSTEQNISNFKRQLDNIGFCFDWSRQVNTSDPHYYKWTQWIFLQLFKSFFNRQKNKAENIEVLIKAFEEEGNKNHPIPGSGYRIPIRSDLQFNENVFDKTQWKKFDDKLQHDILMQYRLAYIGYGEVNWCAALGTVLANDEVINGVSERGGYPVVKKTLAQWYLRITEYADRLLEGLLHVDFSEAMKEMQSNWIGRSTGAEIDFKVGLTRGPSPHGEESLRVYTTRPDTIFGVDFIVIAPEHELVEKITTAEQSAAVEEYINYVKSRSERERMAEKKITGCFTGAYAINPFNGREIPVWISEYVLAGYGTGAIMAVPCGDERDFKFAKHFNIPITNIIGEHYNGEEANPTKDAKLTNSDFLNGTLMRDAIEIVNDQLELTGIGKKKINYKMRDAAFSRQRYWGEPFPIVWRDGIAYPLDENELPLELPFVESYKPGPEGEGPLANIPEWTAENLETNTMPGYAGSSWYFLRYMDPHNDNEFCNRNVSDYWNRVDLYIGGTEHAVGHLLYSRMWTKALYDLGYISFDEPYKKLVNQGMITGISEFIGRSKFLNADGESFEGYDNFVRYIDENGDIRLENINDYDPDKTYSVYYSIDLANEISEKNKLQPYNSNTEKQFLEIRLPVSCINNNVLDYQKLIKDFPQYKNSIFVSRKGYYHKGFFCKLIDIKEDYTDKIYTKPGIEKMSKSKLNVVNPDDLIDKYGADTFRMYEMFLGPVEQSKPWDTKGIEGVHRFLRKLWRLFFDEIKGKVWVNDKATDAELKVLHKAIKKIEEDTERFSFNTAVSAFMVCVNELSDLKCHKREVFESLLILLTPYAPHISEELWKQLGNNTSILDAPYPKLNEKYLVESTKEYPVSINGKLRTTININLNASQDEVQEIVLSNEVIKKWVDEKQLKKFIFVKGKMVNVVV